MRKLTAKQASAVERMGCHLSAALTKCIAICAEDDADTHWRIAALGAMFATNLGCAVSKLAQYRRERPDLAEELDEAEAMVKGMLAKVINR